MDATQQQQQQQPSSMPMAIQPQQPPQAQNRAVVVRRKSAFQHEKYALKNCHYCNANFLPAPPNHDVEFCSGDCRFSCSIMRHTKAKKMKKQAGKK